jgi:hypothetical protein
MVVVVPKNLDDPPGPCEARVRADIDEVGAGGHEAVDEILREAAVDLGDAQRWPLGTVPPRVVHVRVEPILVREVHRPEGPASVPADIPDPDPWRGWVRRRVPGNDP